MPITQYVHYTSKLILGLGDIDFSKRGSPVQAVQPTFERSKTRLRKYSIVHSRKLLTDVTAQILTDGAFSALSPKDIIRLRPPIHGTFGIGQAFATVTMVAVPSEAPRNNYHPDFLEMNEFLHRKILQ